METVPAHQDYELAATARLNASAQRRLADWDSRVRRGLVESPCLAEHLRLAFAIDPDARVRRRLAARTDLSADVLEHLAGDRSRGVRAALAANPSLPCELAVRLVGDTEWRVRAEAARRDLPTGLIVQLAHDTRVEVRREVAGNPCPTTAAGRILATDEPAVQSSLAGNRALNGQLQAGLAASPDLQVRTALAANPWLAVAAQLRLRVDIRVELRGALTENPATADAVRMPLAHDGGGSVRSRLVRWAHLRPRWLRALLAGAASSVEGGDPGARRHACTPVTLPGGAAPTGSDGLGRDRPGDRQHRLPGTDGARHRDPLIRLAAALNPDLGEAQLQRLLRDTDADVRQATRRQVLPTLAGVG